MKKILAIVVASLVLLIAACGAEEAEVTEPAPCQPAELQIPNGEEPEFVAIAQDMAAVYADAITVLAELNAEVEGERGFNRSLSEEGEGLQVHVERGNVLLDQGGSEDERYFTQSKPIHPFSMICDGGDGVFFPSSLGYGIREYVEETRRVLERHRSRHE